MTHPTAHRRYNGNGLHKRVLVDGVGDCTRPVEVGRETLRDLGLEAAYRRISTEELISRLLDGVVQHDMFKAVLRG